MAELAALPASAVVVEDRYSSIFKLEHVEPGWLAELVVRLAVRYPSVPIVWAENRKLAEEWTYRNLGERVFERFKTRSAADQLWYYRSLASIYRERLPGPMAEELTREVAELESAVGVETA